MLMRAADHRHRRFIAMVLAYGSAFCLLAALSPPALAQVVVAPTPLWAPSSPVLPKSAALVTTLGTPKISSKSAWQELTPAQQLSLKPLAANWNTLGEAKKRKWIAMAANYPRLAPAEQEKLHSRMAEWVSLSQKQRDQARLNFAQSKQLTPTQKAATWQAYQALSPEEKQKLAISATPKPTGAAAAVKPVPPQKLAAIPVTRQTPKQLPRLAAATHGVNRNTLLPHSPPPGKATPAPKN